MTTTMTNTVQPTNFMTSSPLTPTGPTPTTRTAAVMPVTPSASHPASPSHHRLLAGLKRLAAFIGWLLSGFGLLAFLKRRRSARFKIEEIVVYCVPESFFLWAIILTGFIAAAAVRHHGNPILWGWVYVWVLLYTLLTLLFDISSKKFLLWTGIFAFVWVASRYLEDLKHLHVLSQVTGYLKRLQPKLDPGMASVLSCL